MTRPPKPPSQTWKTFLRNHAEAIAAIDMCVVPTLTFDRLFAFLILGHGRRQLLWFEVTRHPAAEWLARAFEDGTRAFEQLVGAKSFEHAIEVQSQYAKKAYDTWVAEASKLGEMYAAVARDAYKPVEKAVTKRVS
jgi:Phasin protein